MLWVLAIAFFIDAPNKVPTSFDAAGNPRGWGSPAFYFMMPAIGLFYGVIIFAATYFPQIINMPVALKENVVVPQSAMMIRCCRWLNIVGQLMFLFILLQMAGYRDDSLFLDNSLFITSLFSQIFLMFAIIIHYCVRISRMK